MRRRYPELEPNPVCAEDAAVLTAGGWEPDPESGRWRKGVFEMCPVGQQPERWELRYSLAAWIHPSMDSAMRSAAQRTVYHLKVADDLPMLGLVLETLHIVEQDRHTKELMHQQWHANKPAGAGCPSHPVYWDQWDCYDTIVKKLRKTLVDACSDAMSGEDCAYLAAEVAYMVLHTIGGGHDIATDSKYIGEQVYADY